MDREATEPDEDANEARERLDGLLFKHRKQAELTQEKLSQISGVSYQTISNIERGLGHSPRPSTIGRLADALSLNGQKRSLFEEAARRWSEDVGHRTRVRLAVPASLPDGPTPATNGADGPARDQLDRAKDVGRRRRKVALSIVAALAVALVAGVMWRANWRDKPQAEGSYEVISLYTFETRPALIVPSKDGTLWFTVQYGDAIWKIPPGGMPTKALQLSAGSHPFGITTAPDGSVWFTEGEADGTSGDAVGKLNSDGTLAHRTSFPKGSELTGIAAAPDGKVWVTAYGTKAVYWIAPDGETMGGPFPVNGHPNRIMIGPDKNIWVTLATNPRVVVLSPDGVQLKDYLVVPNPTDIVAAPDGKVWITSHDSNALQKIDPVTGQVFQPTEVLGGPGVVLIGPDGNFWVTQLSGRAISVVSPTGDVLRSFPVRGGTPFGMSNGPNSSVWFTLQGVSGATPDAIGRITVRT